MLVHDAWAEHLGACKKKLWEKQNQVAIATTPEEINVISW